MMDKIDKEAKFPKICRREFVKIAGSGIVCAGAGLVPVKALSGMKDSSAAKQLVKEGNEMGEKELSLMRRHQLLK